MLPRPPFRKTKIIATIGPASDSPEMLRKMVAAGMNVARLNLSHGTFDEHAERVRRIRQAAEAAGRRLAVMIDTRGSEIRTGRLRNNYADLRRGAEFVLRTDGEPGDEHGVAVTYSKLPREVAGGDVILLDDGAVVHGGRFAGGEVQSFGDHRIAMSLAVAGTVAEGPVTVLVTVVDVLGKNVEKEIQLFVDEQAPVMAYLVRIVKPKPKRWYPGINRLQSSS